MRERESERERLTDRMETLRNRVYAPLIKTIQLDESLLKTYKAYAQSVRAFNRVNRIIPRPAEVSKLINHR